MTVLWGQKVFSEELQSSVHATVTFTTKETSESTQEKRQLSSFETLLHFFNTGKPLSIIPLRVIFLQGLLTFSGPKKNHPQTKCIITLAYHTLEYCFPISVI
jgi:hypothetical protein